MFRSKLLLLGRELLKLLLRGGKLLLLGGKLLYPAPHEGEMFLRGEIEGAGEGDYPGEAIQRDVRDRCLEEFDTYVGAPYATSALEFVFIYPTESNWDDDDGTFACIAYNHDRTDLPPGSVEGSNR